MFAYAIRRLLASIPVLLAGTFFVFVLVASSGDPLQNLKLQTPPVPEESIRLEEKRLHWDKPVPERYAIWLWGLLSRLDFGPSVNVRENIGHEIGIRLGVTLRLVFLAMLFAVILAVLAGVLSAVKQYSKTDYSFTFIGFLFLATPSFWLAILLKQAGIWANGLDGKPSTQIFFTIGDKSAYLDDPTVWNKILDVAGHMVLPTLALALINFASWSRYQRASMLDVLNSDYVRLARAKGLRPRKVLVRHGLRTALIPLTTVTALDIGGLIGGAAITEWVFQWQGMGRYLVESIRDRDVYALMAWLLVAGIVVIIFNLIADILYAILDPRIRHA